MESPCKTEWKNKSERSTGKVAQGCHADWSMPLNLVLLGESHSGKSASGNTILGERVFQNRFPASRSKDKILYFSKLIKGRKVTVIYTDDFPCFSYAEAEGDLTVYLLVIRLDRRFTEEYMLEMQERELKTTIRDRTIILFTRGDELDQHIDDYVRNTDPDLQSLIRQCGGRYQVFNNKNRAERKKQVDELMGKVDELVKGMEKSGDQIYNGEKVGKKMCGDRYQVFNNEDKEKKQVEKVLVKGIGKSGEGKGMHGYRLEKRGGWRAQVKRLRTPDLQI